MTPTATTPPPPRPRPLRASLDSAFLARDAAGNPTFDLKISIDGLGGELAKLDPQLGKIDPAAINTAIELLRNADFDAIGRAVEAAARDAEQVLDHLPGADDLISALANALTRLANGLDAEIGRALADIEAAAAKLAERLWAEAASVADIDVSVGAARLAKLLEQLAKLSGNPLLTLLVTGFAQIAGRVLGGWKTLAAQGAGFASLIRALGSMGGIGALSGQILPLALLLQRPFETGRLEATIGRLDLAAADDAIAAVVQRLDALTDPEDLQALELAAAPILDFAADVKQLAELFDGVLGGALEALRRADVPALVAGLEAHTAALLGAGLSGVDDLAKALRTLLDPLLRLKLPDLSAGKSGADHLSAEMVRAAHRLAQVDPQKIAKPLTDGLAVGVGSLHEIRVTAERVVAVIEAAIRGFATAAGGVDLGAAAEALRRALRPVAEALALMRDAIAAAEQALHAAVEYLEQQIDSIAKLVDTALDEIRGAFQKVDDIVTQAKLDEIVAALRAGVEDVATVLRAAPLQPFIDTALDILNTAADLLAAVPKDLLPAAVRKELDAACDEISRIDFTAVTTTLAKELDDIVDDVRGDVLEELDTLHDDLVAFVKKVDPHVAVQPLEQAFDDLAKRLAQIDPGALLAPVQKALDEVRATVGGFDPQRVLAPIEAAFDTLKAGFAELDPAKLLDGLSEDADALRAKIDAALPIDRAIANVEKADAWLAANLANIDPDKVFAIADGIYDGLVLAVRELTCETGQLAGTLRGVLLAVDLDVPLASLAEGWTWVTGSDGAAVVGERIGVLVGSVAAAASMVDRIDADAMVADLARAHKAIVAALAHHPADSELRRRLDPVLASCDPTTLLAGVAAGRSRHKQACDAALAALRRVEGASWSHVAVTAHSLREDLRPLAAVPEKLRALLAWLGADPEHDGLVKSVNELLEAFRPSVFMRPLAVAIHDLGAKIATVLRQGLLAPARQVLRDIQGLIKLIAFPVPPELVKLHEQLRDGIDKLRPTVVLKDTLDAVQTTVDALVKVDPLSEVKDLVATLQRKVEELVKHARPSILLAPVFDIYDRVLETVEALDAEVLLGPVFDALGDIELQLTSGLTEAGEALDRLKDACKSPGGLSVGVKVLS